VRVILFLFGLLMAPAGPSAVAACSVARDVSANAMKILPVASDKIVRLNSVYADCPMRNFVVYMTSPMGQSAPAAANWRPEVQSLMKSEFCRDEAFAALSRMRWQMEAFINFADGSHNTVTAQCN
jgi:hypothetical protein